ncbi:MAG: hypothetical protein ACXVQ7_13180, partial [Actinomycetota bacterium]
MFARAHASQSSIEDACDALLEADRLTAKALHILSATDVEATCGLPTEILLALRARRTGTEARFMAVQPACCVPCPPRPPRSGAATFRGGRFGRSCARCARWMPPGGLASMSSSIVLR